MLSAIQRLRLHAAHVSKSHGDHASKKVKTPTELRQDKLARKRAAEARRLQYQPLTDDERHLQRDSDCFRQEQAADANRLKMLIRHSDALRMKRMQCRNTWGRLVPNQWRKVQDEFIETVLRAPKIDWATWRRTINQTIGNSTPRPSIRSKKVLGDHFEYHTAAQLRQLGWTVQFLGQSGDQGGDLLAQREGTTLVVQCKHHSSKVGNGAVQEVVAARQFYHASIAAVIATNGFTRQAKALADKTSVWLLAPDQLASLHRGK